MKAADLIAFEARVKAEFEAGRIPGPVHLSGGNEEQLIAIFDRVRRGDYVFSTYRNHYHALLAGVPEAELWAEVMAGRGIMFASPAHRFYTSAIVGGCLPIAVGVAMGVKRCGGAERVWVFVGDMAARGGAFHEAREFARRNDLRVSFVTEDNGMSTNTPTDYAWGNEENYECEEYIYSYTRTQAHYGAGKVTHL